MNKNWQQITIYILLYVLKRKQLLFHFREIYGDGVLGQANLHMVEIGRTYGTAAKFPGSGGAVVGLCLDKQKMVSIILHLFIFIFSPLSERACKIYFRRTRACGCFVCFFFFYHISFILIMPRYTSKWMNFWDLINMAESILPIVLYNVVNTEQSL